MPHIYLHTGTELGEARGYGAGFTLAHQFLDQLPSEMRAAVLANARSRVVFTVGDKNARVPEVLT